MSRHTLKRPFDQKRFDELKRKAQTAINALLVFTGKVHQRNGLLCRLRYRVRTIGESGEWYSQFDGGVFDGQKIFYTLDTLEELVDRVNRFLGFI